MSTVDRGGSSAGQGSSSDSRTAHIIDFDLARCRKIIADLHYRLARFSNSDRFYEEYELALYEYFKGAVFTAKTKTISTTTSRAKRSSPGSSPGIPSIS